MKAKLTCVICGNEFYERYKGQRNTKNYLCSEKCKHIFVSELSSKTMAKTNKKYASERMKKNNPMRKKENRIKVSKTLKKLGCKPVIQGGNGNGPTRQQLAISNMLGLQMEVVVPTKMGRYSGYPSCYKIDVADEENKVGIEIDGKSHSVLERKKQDIKKDFFLRSLGWKIIRVKNEEVDDNINLCLKKIRSLYE